MMYLALLLVVASVAQAKFVPSSATTAYGYLKDSVVEAEKIRQYEENLLNQRIVGGVPAMIEQYPFKVGLISNIIGIDGNGICGGSLISTSRIATAAHCWFDGISQAYLFTAVLGSTTLFSGGTRLQSSALVTHSSWNPLLVRNDVAVLFLPSPVATSNSIAPIALPSGSEILEDYTGSAAIVSGYGFTSEDELFTTSQSLHHVSVNVISNSACSSAYPLILQSTNICTSGIGGVGICGGDSGGPLIVNRNSRSILIGVSSFRSGLGCSANLPSGYARVTAYLDFFRQYLD